MSQPVQLSQEQFTELLQTLTGGNAGGNARGGTGGTGESSSKSVKAVRPNVDVDTTEGEWAVFEDNWGRFKRMSKLTAATEIRDNLRQCCAAQLNKMLFDVKGPATLNSATEENLLNWIKAIAVKEAHKEVHRTQFVSIKQKQGEGGNAYYSRLKAAASFCDFRVPAPSTCGGVDCTCPNHGMEVSYQDDMVSTQLVAGLYSGDHQSKILSESATLNTLDDKLNKLLVLEKSDTSLSSLGGADAFVNYSGRRDHDYSKKGAKDGRRRREKEDAAAKAKNTSGGSCPECHQKHPQCTICKGYHKCTTKCNSCKEMGHIKNCCPKSLASLIAAATAVTAANVNARNGNNDNPNGPEVEDEENIAFGFMVAITEQPGPYHKSPTTSFSVHAHQISTHLLSHMECKDASFRVATPAKAPLIRVVCKLLIANHAIYGRYTTQDDVRQKKKVKTSGLADTGAQVCTAGPNLLSQFHIDLNFLIPTRLEVKGITHFPVTMLGALFLEVSSNGMCTQQIVYIAHEARSLILSETALKDLGVIPTNFPTAGSFDGSPLRQERVAPNIREVAGQGVGVSTRLCCVNKLK